MDTQIYLEALNEALARHGRPEIFNTDQDSQFTSLDFIGALKDAGVAISRLSNYVGQPQSMSELSLRRHDSIWTG